MDGARLMNATYATGNSPSQIVRCCNTTTFCINKSLGAPIGSALLGDKSFIEK